MDTSFVLERQRPGRRARLAWALAFVLPLALAIALALPGAGATEAPPPVAFNYVLETFGPNYPISQGAWYSNPANGVGVGYYYVDILIPCGWPANRSVSIDLFSPELNSSGASDEARANGRQPTVFELYQPGTLAGPGIGDPGPGAAGSITQVEFQPSTAQARWRRFHTLPAPVACGAYLLRSEARDDDGNVWRLRVGYDDDNDPTDSPPTRYDDPDGLPGSGDEPIIGVLQTGFKHPSNPSSCLTLYEYVPPGQPQIAFHNFDMESSGTVSYVSPSGQVFAGTPSARIRWNNGTLTDRGAGDPIPSPESGWWQIVTCAGSDTHFVQEGQQGVPSYFQQPPAPRMVVSKDDGRYDVNPNEQLHYTIQFTNTASLEPALAVPGSAHKLVVVDTLPPHTIFQNCAIASPLIGSCAESGGVVTFTLDGRLDAGLQGSVELNVLTAPDIPPGLVRNQVALAYQDSLGNPYAASASDTDQLVAADLSLAKTVDQPRPNVGDTVTFAVTLRNDGPAVATNVAVSDVLPAGLALVSATADAGSYRPGTGLWTVGTLPVGAQAQLLMVARATRGGLLTNTAQVSAADQRDPDSTPGNGNPGEDDQASAQVRPLVADLRLSKGASNYTAHTGDTLVYTIAVTNDGPDAASGVAVSDPLPSGLVFQSASASQGSYDPTTGSWAVGDLGSGQRATLTLSTLVATDRKVINTAQVSASAQWDPDSTPGNSNPGEDDQASVTTPIATTAVELAEFAARRLPGRVRVSWVTTAEVDTWGFDLYRSDDGLRAHAVRVTPQSIVAQGRGQAGASYSWDDTGAGAGQPAYWLVETETGGATHEYGPVAPASAGTSATWQVFVPLAVR